MDKAKIEILEVGGWRDTVSEIGALAARGIARIPDILTLSLLLVGVFAVGAIAGHFATRDHFKIDWERKAARAAEERLRYGAVAAGAARWDNTKDGVPRFRWTFCNPLGFKR